MRYLAFTRDHGYITFYQYDTYTQQYSRADSGPPSPLSLSSFLFSHIIRDPGPGSVQCSRVIRGVNRNGELAPAVGAAKYALGYRPCPVVYGVEGLDDGTAV